SEGFRASEKPGRRRGGSASATGPSASGRPNRGYFSGRARSPSIRSPSAALRSCFFPGPLRQRFGLFGEAVMPVLLREPAAELGAIAVVLLGDERQGAVVTLSRHLKELRRFRLAPLLAGAVGHRDIKHPELVGSVHVVRIKAQRLLKS